MTRPADQQPATQLGAPKASGGRVSGSVPLEKDVQRAVVQIYRTVRCKVYNLSQGFRPGGKRHATTRQTKGLGDLYIIPPQVERVEGIVVGSRLPFWHETKRIGGKVSPEQLAFQWLNEEAGIVVVIGGKQEALAHLQKLGLWRAV